MCASGKKLTFGGAKSILKKSKKCNGIRGASENKTPAPADEEILSYDNVPVSVAALYLDWPEQTVRQALREDRATFGVAVRDEGVTFKISPSGLVKYKREGIPCFDHKTIREMLRSATAEVIQKEIHNLKLAIYE